jgi:chitinase
VFANITARSCADAKPWAEGTPYQEGDPVVHGDPRRKFECRPWPNTPWCWLPDYEPGKYLHYEDAWIDRGRCP